MIRITKKDNQALEYISVGKNHKKIILFCGFKSNINRWNKEFIYTLSKYFQVFCVNYPQIGQSISNKINYIEDYVTFALEMLNIKNGDNFYLLGHSMGGYAVKSYLNLKNVPIPKAVVFSNTSAGGTLRVKASAETQNILMNSDQKSKEYINLMIGQEIEYKDLLKTFLSDIEISVTKQAANFQESLILNYFKNKEYCESKIEVPTCVIHGTSDLIFPIQNAINLINLCTNRNVLKLNNGYHNHFFNYPRFIANQISKFVARS